MSQQTGHTDLNISYPLGGKQVAVHEDLKQTAETTTQAIKDFETGATLSAVQAAARAEAAEMEAKAARAAAEETAHGNYVPLSDYQERAAESARDYLATEPAVADAAGAAADQAVDLKVAETNLLVGAGVSRIVAVEEFSPAPALEDGDLVLRYRDSDTTAVDRFDRPDATTLGAADTGQAWTAVTGTWGISGGRATLTAKPSSTAMAAVRTDLTDARIFADIYPAGGDWPGIILTDSETRDAGFGFRVNADGLAELVRFNPSVSSLTTFTNYGQVAPGARLSMSLRWSETSALGTPATIITCHIDDEQVVYRPDALRVDAVWAGFVVGGTTVGAHWDNFHVSQAVL